MATMTLDHIMFELKEPAKSKALEQFLMNDEQIKIKYSGRGTFKRKLKTPGGVVDITIPPAGKWLGRRTAIEVLYRWGKGGVLRGKDPVTALTEVALNAFRGEEREYWMKRDLKFDKEYLYDATHEIPEPESTPVQPTPTEQPATSNAS